MHRNYISSGKTNIVHRLFTLFIEIHGCLKEVGKLVTPQSWLWSSPPEPFLLLFLRISLVWGTGRGDLIKTAAVYKFLNQIKLYDFATYMHCQRVARISIAIGQGLTLDQAVLKSLYYSALLHDLGKVNIPKGILSREEKLTPLEWDIIHQHPATGGNMIQAEKTITEDIVAGVLAHHERWNGKGYPYGLAGDNIPLFGRIISIADALDAMTSVRPYRRRPLPFGEAISEIQSLSGQQFDPYIACSLETTCFIKQNTTELLLKCDLRRLK